MTQPTYRSADALEVLDRIASALDALRCWSPVEFSVPDPFDAKREILFRWRQFKGVWQFMWIRPDGTESQADNMQAHVRLALCAELYPRAPGLPWGPLERIFHTRDLVRARFPAALARATETAALLEQRAEQETDE